MPDDLLWRLRRFREHTFPGAKDQFRALVRDGQRPTALFIGCSDSRLMPSLLTGCGPGEFFMVRNVGAFVPPCDCRLGARGSSDAGLVAEDSHGSAAAGSLAGHHGTAAAIEFAVLNLGVA